MRRRRVSGRRESQRKPLGRHVYKALTSFSYSWHMRVGGKNAVLSISLLNNCDQKAAVKDLKTSQPTYLWTIRLPNAIICFCSARHFQTVMAHNQLIYQCKHTFYLCIRTLNIIYLNVYNCICALCRHMLPPTQTQVVLLYQPILSKSLTGRDSLLYAYICDNVTPELHDGMGITWVYLPADPNSKPQPWSLIAKTRQRLLIERHRQCKYCC